MSPLPRHSPVFCPLQALTLSKSGGHPEDETRALSGMGAIYQKQGKLSRALECHQQAPPTPGGKHQGACARHICGVPVF